MSTPLVHPDTPSKSHDFTSRKGELHFFIIWELARHKEKDILVDIGKHFEILECFDMFWSPCLAVNNFCRLYDSDKKSGQQHAKEYGAGRFLLITVWDNNPVYQLAEDHFGFEYVNINVFEVKKRYCGWCNSKTDVVYASSRAKEANRNLTLLLGKNVDDYLASVKTPWKGAVVQADRNLLGAEGWNSVEEVFYALNNTVKYVVLRNFEELSQHIDSSIDILTEDRETLIRLLNPPKVNLFLSREQVKVNVGGQQIQWNVRYVGDNYYCLPWEQNMLRDRVLTPGNVYALNKEHHFYSFIYHTIIHDKKLEPDSYAKAARLLESFMQTGAAGITVSEKEMFSDPFDYYFDLLTDYMKRNGYVFDHSLRGMIYNQFTAVTSQIAGQLEEKFGLDYVRPFPIRVLRPYNKIAVYALPFTTTVKKNKKIGYRYTFYWALLNGKKIFIKHGGRLDWFEREFRFCSRLHKVNEHNFPNPFFYTTIPSYRCVAVEFLIGQTLGTRIQSADFSSSERKDVIVQLKQIAQSFIETGIKHQDVHADNIVVTKEGKLKMIDFVKAGDSKHPEECHVFKRNPLFRYECAGCIGNAHLSGLLSILEEIGCRESYQETYKDAETFLREHIGNVVKCKGARFNFLTRSWSKVRHMVKGALRRIRKCIDRQW